MGGERQVGDATFSVAKHSIPTIRDLLWSNEIHHMRSQEWKYGFQHDGERARQRCNSAINRWRKNDGTPINCASLEQLIDFGRSECNRVRTSWLVDTKVEYHDGAIGPTDPLHFVGHLCPGFFLAHLAQSDAVWDPPFSNPGYCGYHTNYM